MPSRVLTQWKGPLALLSLVLATLIWLLGLSDSLSRKSVAPALSLQQQELSVLAEPALPPSFRPFLATPPPRQALLEALETSKRSSALRVRARCWHCCVENPTPHQLQTQGDPLIRCWTGCAVKSVRPIPIVVSIPWWRPGRLCVC